MTGGRRDGVALAVAVAVVSGTLLLAPVFPATVQGEGTPRGADAPGDRSAAVTGATISPTSSDVFPQGVLTLNASAACGAGPCGPGVSFSWFSDRYLGSLNISTGPSVLFTASTAEGTDPISVNASEGATYAIGWANVTISSVTSGTHLVGVIVSPTSAQVGEGDRQMLAAVPSCSPRACPSSGISYAWGLTNTLGSLNASVGPDVTYLAPSDVTGSLEVDVNASWEGSWFVSTSSVEVVAPATPPPGPRQNATSPEPTFLGLPEDEAAAIVGGGGIALLALVTQLYLRRRRREEPPHRPELPSDPALTTDPEPTTRTQASSGASEGPGPFEEATGTAADGPEHQEP